jgi:FAD/FMN-containing dehydrogenase
VAAIDRRSFVERAGRAAFASSVVPWWQLPQLLEAVDPRVRTLDRELRGEVVARGASGYDAARLLRNTRFDGLKPLAVAFCESADDVARCVRFARRHGVQLAARSGGHSYGGYSSVSGGLVVDVSRLRAVTLAGDGTTATSGAGAQLGHVYEQLWNAGRVTIPAGSCSTVGIAGLTLGGGHGFASRAFGLTCDSLRSLRIVTADGKVLDADPLEHADLLWASRGGGGGTFGIVTSFRFGVHPVGRVSTFTVEWPWSDAPQALAAWQAWAPAAPPGLFTVLSLSAAAGGQPAVRAVGQYLGPAATLAGLLTPLANAGAPTRVSTVDREWLASTRYWGGGTARGTFAARSDYAFRPLSRAGLRALLDGVEARTRGPAGAVTVLLDSYGGAIRRTPSGGSAFAHREALFSLQEIAAWAPGGPAAANLAWLAAFHASLRPHLSGFAYVNYVDPMQRDWQRAYFGRNLRRLQAIKKRYDPGEVFRFRQSIRPR